MTRFKSPAVLLMVASLLLLPLYELADIGERWPHDGDIVLILFSILFLAAVLIICRGIARVCLQILKRVWQPAPPALTLNLRWSLCPRADFPLFLLLCDFRV